MSYIEDKISKCRCCGAITPLPEYLYIYEVGFHYFLSKLYVHKGYFCDKCASKLSIKYLLKSILFGTLTLPFGPIYVLVAVCYNMCLGKIDKKQTYRQLFKNAEALFLDKRYDEALIVYNRARKYAKTDLQKHNLNILGYMIMKEGHETKVRNGWNLFGKSSFWIGIVIIGSFLALVAHLGFLAYEHHNQPKPIKHQKIEQQKTKNYQDFQIMEIPYLKEAQNLTYKIKQDGAMIYNGPGYKFDIIGELKKDEEVFITAIIPNSNWIRVRLGSGRIGFIIKHTISH